MRIGRKRGANGEIAVAYKINRIQKPPVVQAIFVYDHPVENGRNGKWYVLIGQKIKKTPLDFNIFLQIE
jgi:hypothetical protein